MTVRLNNNILSLLRLFACLVHFLFQILAHMSLFRYVLLGQPIISKPQPLSYSNPITLFIALALIRIETALPTSLFSCVLPVPCPTLPPPIRLELSLVQDIHLSHRCISAPETELGTLQALRNN